MTTPQILAVTIIGIMMFFMLWGRFRYDIVAILALIAAVAVGIVPAKAAFSGFADDVVIIVGSALVVSAAVARTGIVERALRYVAPYIKRTQAQVIVLVATVAFMSAFIKNIGALAMLMPVAFLLARRHNVSPSLFLMPMSFAALLGGIVTLVGTSPNIIVSRVRQELTGQPFTMFDFTPVGLGIALAGVAFLAVGYRLIPKGRRGTVSLTEALAIKDYVTEAHVTADSPIAGRTVADLKRLADGNVTVTAIVRKRTRSASPFPDAVLRPGDIVLLEGDPAALEQLVDEAELALEGNDRDIIVADPAAEIGTVEAVIGPNAVVIGQTPRQIELHNRHGVNLLAVSRANKRFTERLRDIKLRAGDVLVIQGDLSLMPERLGTLGLLPLVERTLAIGSRRRGLVALAILAVTVGVLAAGVVTVPIAFFAAAAAFVLFRVIPTRSIYDEVEWPIIVMLAALIPVSDALRTTGATDVFAAWLAQVGAGLPAWGAVGMIMLAAMAVTPFLNNAATVLVMAPIAAGFANGLGYRPDAFLMAVAMGAACDFLTPIGHQCNTLVMGPGGYKFSDYARLGLPLSMLVVALGVPLILVFWPLR